MIITSFIYQIIHFRKNYQHLERLNLEFHRFIIIELTATPLAIRMQTCLYVCVCVYERFKFIAIKREVISIVTFVINIIISTSVVWSRFIVIVCGYYSIFMTPIRCGIFIIQLKQNKKTKY